MKKSLNLTIEKITQLTNYIWHSVKIVGLEGFIWTFSLIYLAFYNLPFNPHFTICPLSNIGFDHCPGGGLGNSISLIFNGHLAGSVKTHILGIPALLIIISRIFTIIRFNLNKEKIISQLRSDYA